MIFLWFEFGFVLGVYYGTLAKQIWFYKYFL